MIILDIETTGTNPVRNCLLSIGAVDYDTGSEFYGECSITPGKLIHPKAMEINGFREEDVAPGVKLTPGMLYQKFIFWAAQVPDKLIAGQNVGHLDIPFLEEIHAECFGPYVSFPFGYRSLDLHSVSFAVFGVSLNHREICERLCLPGEPKPHHALSGARSERDCFRALFGMLKKNEQLIL